LAYFDVQFHIFGPFGPVA